MKLGREFVLAVECLNKRHLVAGKGGGTSVVPTERRFPEESAGRRAEKDGIRLGKGGLASLLLEA